MARFLRLFDPLASERALSAVFWSLGNYNTSERAIPQSTSFNFEYLTCDSYKEAVAQIRYTRTETLSRDFGGGMFLQSTVISAPHG